MFNVLFLASLEQPSGQNSFPFRELIQEVSAQNDAGGNAFISEDTVSESYNDQINFIIIDSTALLNANNPLSNVIPSRNGLLVYKIQSGDNLSKIAANFGISVNTLFWANPNLKNTILTPGQEVVILPVNGVLHQVQSDETPESVAQVYGISAEKISQFNKGLTTQWVTGATIIIPDGKPLRNAKTSLISDLPNLIGYFAIPTTGWNWGRLHNYNAVDIANACGTPVYAAAEGLVIESSDDSWNGGYGRYVVLEHPNGTKTKYAHNQKNIVSIGDYVVKGDQIAIIGNTGNTHGPTGCHLHFEIVGARNPFAK
ncbi:MAG TPA: peptidoglycan DD-metalloendopeptidase family protein [Candidatus Paceibacterota bacterium]